MNMLSDPRIYTVGWICAVVTEYVAAQVFLDEVHEGPEQLSHNDNNDYTLGKIGRHNVVIAVLPNGEYGTSSAASVARDMLHSFINIRFGLLVGIGGGAPNLQHDIRLGDVVVGATGDGKGGVFQYDSGKRVQGEKFKETGFLNQAPTILRAAVNGLKSQHERMGNQLEDAIDRILDKNQRLQCKYRRPRQGTDKLFKAHLTHSSICKEACGDDPSTLISRPERKEYQDNPAVHYGLIASANQLIKDALFRDQLAAEMNVLCFEMEAAGLMNHFPCLVVRGICDYSDSHKNKDWQGYAAMSAAAYSKHLLSRIPLTRVAAEKTVLSSIEEALNKVRHATDDTNVAVKKLSQYSDHQEREAILTWLTRIDFASLQRDNIERRQPGTGQWFLESAQFRNWLESEKQNLFCQGMPGAGKTVMSSIVIDHLWTRFKSDATAGVAYIYCNFQRSYEQKPVDLLLSLLKQLTQGLPCIPVCLKDLYGDHKKHRTRPSRQEIIDILLSVFAEYSRVFIIIDALDECQNSDGERRTFLSELLKLQAKAKLKIFATARFNLEIQKVFKDAIRAEIRATDQDMQRYLQGKMIQLLPAFVLNNRRLQQEIQTEIAGIADGVILLAQLIIQSLRGLGSVDSIKTALRRIAEGPNTYDDAYENAMNRINGQLVNSRNLADQVLSWITYAKRPLSTHELQHALAVKACTSSLNKESLPEMEEIVSSCAGLVTVDAQSEIIRLVHYTAQEYLERKGAIWLPDAQNRIARACISYLSFDVFNTGFCPTDKEFEARLRSNVLYDYAARNWGHHARMASIGREEEPILNFLESEARVSACNQAMMVSKNNPDYSQDVARRINGLHLTAYLGLRDLMMALLDKGQDPNSRDTSGRTPLSYAAEGGHEAAINILLDKSVDKNSEDSYGWTPLSWAVETRNTRAVQLLLANDVCVKHLYMRTRTTTVTEVNAEWDRWWFDGMLGSWQWRFEVIGAVCWLVLAVAAIWSSQKIDLRELMSTCSDNDSNDNDTKVPPAWQMEREETKQLWKEIWWASPLRRAVENGDEAIVKLLLDKGAYDRRSRSTLLSIAQDNGYEAVLKLLRDKGSWRFPRIFKL